MRPPPPAPPPPPPPADSGRKPRPTQPFAAPKVEAAPKAKVKAPRAKAPRREAKPVDRAARAALLREVAIVAAGLTTTVAMLGIYWGIGAPDVFGMYRYMLPLGAVGVGFSACSGYGIAGFLLKGLRLKLWMVVGIVGSMFLAYWGIEFMRYLEEAPGSMGFFAYYDFYTRHAVWTMGVGGTTEPLGWSGYNYRFLELVGVMAGGFGGVMIVPLMARSRR